MSEPERDVEVTDAPDQGRFEVRRGGTLAGIAEYVVVPGEPASDDAAGRAERIVFFHTEVLPAFEGQGLAAALAEHALRASIAAGRAVVTVCPYFTTYVRRHRDEYGAHVVPATQADLDAVDAAG